MPARQVFPTIPVPSDDPKSLRATCDALKRVVEMLTTNDTSSRDGQRHNRYAPHVFMQDAEPTALHPGDMWLQQGENWRLNMWDGTAWRIVAVLP